MREDLERKVDYAMTTARTVVGAAMRAAAEFRDVGEQSPDHVEQMAGLAVQMYAVADVARDAERELACIHAELRPGVTP